MLRSTLFAAFTLSISAAHAQMPDAIAAPGQVAIASFHAVGAQIYECKPDAAGKLDWRFREPIATLLAGGQTVGHHYAGPSWTLNDGSTVVAKSAASSPGATSADIAWLRLDVTAHRGNGRLDGAVTVQRIDTKGGVAPATCAAAGSLLSIPYSAEYVFLRRE